MSVQTWWYEQNGQQKGPISKEELLLLFNQEFLNEETLVWQQGMPNWMKIGSVKTGMLSVPINQINTTTATSHSFETERKDWLTALLLCLLLGTLGIHRFYTGHTGIAVVQLLTLGGCGIWTLVDLIMIITQKYTDANGQLLLKS